MVEAIGRSDEEAAAVRRDVDILAGGGSSPSDRVKKAPQPRRGGTGSYLPGWNQPSWFRRPAIFLHFRMTILFENIFDVYILLLVNKNSINKN